MRSPLYCAGPPGGAPLFLSERALEKIKSRKTPPATYNLDLNLIGDYWGWFGKRSYHHTGESSGCAACSAQAAFCLPCVLQ